MDQNSLPGSEYQRRLALHAGMKRKHMRTDLVLANLRGFLFAAIVVVLLAAVNYNISFFWAAVPVVCFAAAAIAHERVLQARDRETRIVSHYERGLARLEDRWAGSGEPGARFADATHPYAEDLDIFGSGSLFELMCIARTLSGEETLAAWLKRPATRDVVIERQEAVRELRDRLDFREDLAMLASDARKRMHPRELLRWAEQPPVSFSPGVRIAALVLPAFLLVTVLGWGFLGWNANPFVITVLAEIIFLRRTRKQTQEATRGAEGAVSELELLSGILSRTERETFGSALLSRRQAMLRSNGRPPSLQIAKIGRLLELLDWQRNQLFAVPAMLLLWETHIAIAVEAWRNRCGARIREWLDAVGELEALSCFSAYLYEHPDAMFPEIAVDGPCFEANGLGHPLIPRKRCVRNDVSLNPQLRVLLVSGSNMSGKSTLLRTIGINAVMALAGAPVCASQLRLSVLQAGASIHILDSLQSGSSRFYAEITRLRQLMDLAAGGTPPLLFLLDEILHGTNSADRLTGAEAIVRSLMKSGAIGLLTTHDLALTRIAEAEAPLASNIHFQDHIEDGRIAFDYRIHPGVVTKSNAVALMRSVGLQV